MAPYLAWLAVAVLACLVVGLVVAIFRKPRGTDIDALDALIDDALAEHHAVYVDPTLRITDTYGDAAGPTSPGPSDALAPAPAPDGPGPSREAS